MTANKLNVSFKVTQGIVHANSVSILQLTPHVLLFTVDFRNKRPTAAGTDGGATFWFGADEHTLGVVDPHANLTCVAVKGLAGAWRIRRDSRLYTTVEMGRYSATVYIVKAGRKRIPWWSTDD